MSQNCWSSLGQGRNKSQGSKKGNAEIILMLPIFKAESLEKKCFVNASAVASEKAETILKNSQFTTRESIQPRLVCQYRIMTICVYLWLELSLFIAILTIAKMEIKGYLSKNVF